jgi:Na+/H+ antiporter NhaC
VQLAVDDRRYTAIADSDGIATFTVMVSGVGERAIEATDINGERKTSSLRVLPGYISIAPAMLAIFVALILRNVIPALLLGLWFGAAALRSFSPEGIFLGLLDSFQVYVVRALADPDHAAIILFSLMIGGMVGIITRNGGMAAIVLRMVNRARTAVSGQVSVALMGVMIFFDDYSNTLVVGNTARSLTDHLKISREKLAYIVDSTAAPVVCIALITTWIGYEVGLIDAAIGQLSGVDEAAYTVFLHSIPYSFYPILAVFFVFAVASSGRDWGPMYKAEVRARGGQVSPVSDRDLPAMQGDRLDMKDGVSLRPINALLPIAVLIVSLVVGLYMTGEGDTLTEIIGSADSYKAMLWASLLGALVAAAMTVGQRVLDTQETVDAWFGGVRAMLFAMIVLVLAWALSNVTEHLHTADYLVSVLADTLPPPLLPATVFLLSAITAFTTGTSWGTMGILMPLVIPLCWAVMQQHGMTGPDDMHILYSAIACNLAGAVWGDHCSPISDTTVLSSMASGCDHIEHVRTQMPYALLVGTVAVLVGTVPGGYGFPPLLSIVLGVGILLFALRTFGRRADNA